MRNKFLSEYEFKNNCPCSYYLTAYAQSLFSASTTLVFCKAAKSLSDENTYTAEFDAVTRSGKVFCYLEVSCTKLPDNSFSYAVITKTDIP